MCLRCNRFLEAFSLVKIRFFYLELGHGLSGTNEFNRLSFELCGAGFAWLNIYLG